MESVESHGVKEDMSKVRRDSLEMISRAKDSEDEAEKPLQGRYPMKSSQG